jgi:hypothetical protein
VSSRVSNRRGGAYLVGQCGSGLMVAGLLMLHLVRVGEQQGQQQKGGVYLAGRCGSGAACVASDWGR